MSTTDSRSGFRLPWTADAPDAGSTGDGPQDAEISPAEGVTTDPSAGAEPSVEATSEAHDPWRITSAPTPSATAEPVRRKPNKLMADLARAMQAAAEAAREETLTRLQSEAKTVTEEIHGRSGTEAAELRQSADEDVARIRDWSKAEIARIREETDERIAERKATLEEEIEDHAARIEQRIERVQSRVAAFEQEMAAFFERLLAEEDPTALAAMAENLPEPPEFDTDEPAIEATKEDDAIVDAPVEPADREAAFAAIQAAAEAAVTADQGSEAAAEAGADDPRLSALGLSVGSAEEAEAAAEADAAAEPVANGGVEEIPTLPDDAVAARLSGLVGAEDAPSAAQQAVTTRVVVVGLVSVASIAGFKRQLGRLEGVRSVGVSSGPDGEFVFAIEHDAAVSVRDAVTTLPGFGARVTDETEDAVFVTARDPETES